MGDRWELFQKFMITESADINVTDFLINSAIVIVIALILEFTYSKCAKSLSNRKLFANNFLLLIFTTMVIITIVKSSLALSLGLVGALSIVRFRAAIKEPEELAYLFFAISMGLGLGANQRAITLLAFVLLIVILWGRHFIGTRTDHRNLFLTVRGDSGAVDMSSIDALIDKHFKQSSMKRFDDDHTTSEASYQVDVKDSKEIIAFKELLSTTHPNVSVGFMDIES
jgi:hypothetical protein